MSCPMLRPPRRQYLEVLPFIVEPYRPNFHSNPSDSSFSISPRGSIQKRTHRGAAEGAEQRVLDQEIFRSLRTLRLCGEMVGCVLTYYFGKTSSSSPISRRNR